MVKNRNFSSETAFTAIALLAISFYFLLMFPAGACYAAAPMTRAAKPFYCIGYSGYRDGQSPGGAQPTEAQVREDLDTLIRYTHGIRTYSSSPGVADFVPRLCEEVGLNLYMGVWIDQDEAANQREIDNAIRIVNEGHPCIKSVIVGNEYILRADVDHGIPIPTAEAKIIDYLKYVKARIPSSIIVTTAEPVHWWKMVSNALWDECDEIYWHIHPWWDSQAIGNAVDFVNTMQNDVNTRLATIQNPDKPAVITETGWPDTVNHGAGVGSLANQQTYIKDLHAWAFPKKIPFFYFEAFDEKWKDEPGGVGSHWGMWYSNRTPKPIIQNLASLVPPAQWWPDQSVNVITPGASPHIEFQPGTGVEYDEIQVYTIQGRRIIRNKTHDAGAILKCNVGTGIFVVNYLNSGNHVKTNRILFK